MAEEILLRTPACARCWSFHRVCLAHSIFISCKTCTQHVRYGRVSDPFPRLACHSPILDGSMPCVSVDTDVLDTDTWSLTFTSPAGVEKLLTFESSGLFSTANRALIPLLDERIRQLFSADLKDKDSKSQLVSCAILAGGYMTCYCSIAESVDSFEVFVDGHLEGSGVGENQLAGSFKRLLFIRLGELIDNLMSSIRDHSSDEIGAEQSTHLYAATVVLHREVNQLQKSLRQGDLQTLVPDTVPNEFLGWLTSLENELADYTCDGCGKHPSWQSSITGSMRKFSRHKRGEQLKLSVKVQQNRHGYMDVASQFASEAASFLDKFYHTSPRQGNKPRPLLSSLPEPFFGAFSDVTYDPTYYHQTPANTTSGSLAQVPESISFDKEFVFGQMPSSHFSDEMDLIDLDGIDVYMASQDPENPVGDDWMAFQVPYF